jgi:signal transduction histidine kinase
MSQDPIGRARPARNELLGGLLRQTHGTRVAREGLWRLIDAILGIASADLTLASVLERVVDVARDTVEAEYAALGVIGDSRQLREFVHCGLHADTVARIGHLPEGHGILGLLISTPQVLRLDDLTAHPASVGFPAHHPPMHSFLGVPITVDGQVYGNLYLTNKRDGRPFTEDDCELVITLAAAAAAAIADARRHEDALTRERWLAATQELTSELLAGADGDAVRRQITSSALLLADAALSALILRGADGMRVETARGLHADGLTGARIGDDGSPAARAATSHHPLLVDVGADQEDDPLLTSLSTFGSTMYVPLRTAEHRLGVLVIAREKGQDAFTPQQLRAAEQFADQAALALDYGHATDERRRADLYAERERISHDLHDIVIQRLFATGLDLDSLSVTIAEPEAQERLTGIVDHIDAAIADLRSSIFSLHARREGATTLERQLEEIFRDAETMLGFAPDCTIDPVIDITIPDELVHHLLATVRELLANVGRHAEASQVTVRLRIEGPMLRVVVTDDGRGMRGHAVRSGLANLQVRAERLGGGMHIADADGGGTTVAWHVPVR